MKSEDFLVNTTMISAKQLEIIGAILVENLGTPGDVIEVGCHAGRTSRYLQALLQEYNSEKKLYLYDSFQGLPESGLMKTAQANVGKVFSEAELPLPEIVAGWFADTMPEKLPESIAFAFIDCDLYRSFADCLPHIIPRLTGAALIHDYYHTKYGKGVRRAVKEFFGRELPSVCGMAYFTKDDCF